MRAGLGTMVVLAVAAPAVAAAPASRFFLAGDGTVALVSAHTGERAMVTYRRPDGTYDAAALARIRRVMRSSDGAEGDVSLRLVELLAWVYDERGRAPLTIQSGYRSPAYNAAIRARGARAAGASLHTEGLAADVRFAKAALRPLWIRVRDLACCGVGLYVGEGFLHLDVGPPRFWEPATSRVEENLSAGNARLFARTEYDRYAGGEPVTVTLHALTAPPVRIADAARVVSADGEAPVHVAVDAPEHDGCFEVDAASGPLRVTEVPAASRGRLVLRTCEPRPERTPPTVETNPVEVVR